MISFFPVLSVSLVCFSSFSHALHLLPHSSLWSLLPTSACQHSSFPSPFLLSLLCSTCIPFLIGTLLPMSPSSHLTQTCLSSLFLVFLLLLSICLSHLAFLLCLCCPVSLFFLRWFTLSVSCSYLFTSHPSLSCASSLFHTLLSFDFIFLLLPFSPVLFLPHLLVSVFALPFLHFASFPLLHFCFFSHTFPFTGFPHPFPLSVPFTRVWCTLCLSV